MRIRFTHNKGHTGEPTSTIISQLKLHITKSLSTVVEEILTCKEGLSA
jgi:hypothetical protein